MNKIAELQKSAQPSSGQNFQSLHEPFSKCCKVGLSNEAWSLISSERRHEYRNRSSFVNFCFVQCLVDTLCIVLTWNHCCPFCKPSSPVITVSNWKFPSFIVRNIVFHIPWHRLLCKLSILWPDCIQSILGKFNGIFISSSPTYNAINMIWIWFLVLWKYSI